MSNSDKKLQFRYIDLICVSIKVFHLLENCYYDSKSHFVQWYFGQESHFLINSWEKKFFEKGVNLVVFGKMTIDLEVF